MFDWGRFLGFAEEIRGSEWPSSVQQAPERATVSRAYYAVFHAARQRLEREGKTIEKQDTHAEVIRAFESSSEPPRRKIGVRLRALRKRRNEADYDDFVTFSRADVDEEMELARTLVRLIRELPTP